MRGNKKSYMVKIECGLHHKAKLEAVGREKLLYELTEELLTKYIDEYYGKVQKAEDIELKTDENEERKMVRIWIDEEICKKAKMIATWIDKSMMKTMEMILEDAIRREIQ